MTGPHRFRKSIRGDGRAGSAGPAVPAPRQDSARPDPTGPEGQGAGAGPRGPEPSPADGFPDVRTGGKDTRGRGRRTASLAAARAARAREGAVQGLSALADRLAEAAPRIPVRDLAALRRQFPGLDAEQLADRLVAGATKGSATVGAGVGAAAALPVPPAMTVELAAETLGVALVEVKLIAELHEVYGLRAPGNATQRGYAYLASWTNRRGVDVLKQGGIASALGSGVKRELRQRLLRRTVRNLPTLSPFLIGAVIGGTVNRRDTRKLAETIRADLRSRAVPWDRLDEAAAPAPSPLPGQRTPPPALGRGARPAADPTDPSAADPSAGDADPSGPAR